MHITFEEFVNSNGKKLNEASLPILSKTDMDAELKSVEKYKGGVSDKVWYNIVTYDYLTRNIAFGYWGNIETRMLIGNDFDQVFENFLRKDLKLTYDEIAAYYHISDARHLTDRLSLYTTAESAIEYCKGLTISAQIKKSAKDGLKAFIKYRGSDYAK